jgi:hypothetical protein
VAFERPVSNKNLASQFGRPFLFPNFGSSSEDTNYTRSIPTARCDKTAVDHTQPVYKRGWLRSQKDSTGKIEIAKALFGFIVGLSEIWRAATFKTFSVLMGYLGLNQYNYYKQKYNEK